MEVPGTGATFAIGIGYGEGTNLLVAYALSWTSPDWFTARKAIVTLACHPGGSEIPQSGAETLNAFLT